MRLSAPRATPEPSSSVAQSFKREREWSDQHVCSKSRQSRLESRLLVIANIRSNVFAVVLCRATISQDDKTDIVQRRLRSILIYRPKSRLTIERESEVGDGARDMPVSAYSGCPSSSSTVLSVLPHRLTDGSPASGSGRQIL